MPFDVSIIRPEMRLDDIKFRGKDFAPERLARIQKGLRAFQTLETMAANIYKFQIRKSASELDRQLVAAMANEMTHLQDFQVLLFEYGFKPGKLRGFYWLVGFAFGCLSRLLGRKGILKTGIWVETKAVHHYQALLETIDWDEETRLVILKDQADEHGHIDRWKKLLQDVPGHP
jgi:demethoxyubiquinone hydroxylase (CLK1/Coq7/Cat5 family)